jgi:hypothetical protein
MGLLISRIKNFKYTYLTNENINYKTTDDINSKYDIYKIVSSRIKTKLSYSIFIQYKKYKNYYKNNNLDGYTVCQYKDNDIILKIKDKYNKKTYNILLYKHNVLPKFHKIKYYYDNNKLYLKLTLYYSGRVKVYFDYELLLKLISVNSYRIIIYHSDFFVE